MGEYNTLTNDTHMATGEDSPIDPKFAPFLKSIIDGAKGGSTLPPLSADAGFLGDSFVEAFRAGFDDIRLPVSEQLFDAHRKRVEALLSHPPCHEGIHTLVVSTLPILLDGKLSLTYKQATLAFDALLRSQSNARRADDGYSMRYSDQVNCCEAEIIRLFWPATTRGQPIRDWSIDRGKVTAATTKLAEALYDPEQAINVCLNTEDAHRVAREVAAAAETARNAVRDQSPRPGRTP